MLHRLITICLFLLAVGPVSVFAAGDEVPGWLSSAAALKHPTYAKDVPAVVLHDEKIVSVNSDGNLKITSYYAVKILIREGRYFARADEIYLTNTSKVTELKAWLIRADGTTKKYGKDETLDVIFDPDDIYNEYRVKSITAKDDSDVGYVFGYQSVVEERPLFFTDAWLFQDRLPTLMSRYTLAMPNGWKATSATFNRAKVEPVVSGSNYAWELRDLAPIPPEPGSPNVRALAPRINVSYFPSEGPKTGVKNFSTWSEVSSWAIALHDPQVTLDDNVAAKARELTANAKTELEKIQAIGRFVQNMQYISIDIGVGYGNGYRPRPANMVLSRGYGDCKDKANLMRTMLKALNITAYPVAIFSGDRTFVNEEWAAPDQFNHCIIAIKVSDATQVASIVIHPTLGRLLIFDATDPYTQVGDLPDHEQGSWALIIAGGDGKLMRMPVTPPEMNKLDRQAEVTLSADGSITATVRERSIGQSAAFERGAFREMPRPEYNQMIERWITRGVRGAQISKIEPVDNSAENRFALDVVFTSSSYGQLQGGRLLIFKPALVSRLESLSLTEAKRAHPVMLDSAAFTETVRVKLPTGFDVDETPDAAKLETSFGTYTSSYEVKEGNLVFTRTLIQRAATIPVEQYEAVRKFYTSIRAAEQAPVVLLKK
jgi:hypothetical protein